jgi:hypothetical protein
MQADFVAFLRAEFEAEDQWSRWWPETLLFVRRFGPFEIFARAVSKQYFEKVKCLLTIQTPADLKNLFEKYQTGVRQMPRWEATYFDPAQLVGSEHLATKP